MLWQELHRLERKLISCYQREQLGRGREVNEKHRKKYMESRLHRFKLQLELQLDIPSCSKVSSLDREPLIKPAISYTGYRRIRLLYSVSFIPEMLRKDRS
ncbi:hypothetical protein MPTK1_5g12660 [Marchantia polymorpha subsp. ruderalis]|uniref:Uncharacterized protein n=2 Tax=Marchantia polymorpha TaxID=3197 RepID=A0AAF6BHN7_MARPO|nr:hypothetical protein MARPO_0092s0042 [Marchantia polymorpha]BBN11521.1 hypothetical protein Mp_5g12660 [Marchantia polymorpha subsp. ruderalis]|eukprot:PTQ33080.1 hypothetical protein MARPO_0092s0042 [Marchantia polymorpha]